MPETPDFDQIARRAVMTFYGTTPRPNRDEQAAVASIAEQLRLIWNARGAADIKEFDAATARQLDLNAVTRALRSLDR